jgi:hypothetical protein
LTEPLILILILFQAIVLIIQSAKVPVTTPRPAVNRSGVGYFLSWEDWVIFVLFIIFTCVSGSTSHTLLLTSALKCLAESS